MERAIENVLNKHLAVKPFEKLCIITDDKKYKLALKFFEVAKKINLETTLVLMEARKFDGEEPPEEVKRAMKSNDVAIIITEKSLTHTKAARLAKEMGTRIASMPKLDKYSLTKGGLTADPKKIREITHKLFYKLEESNYVEVKSKNGTDVYFSVRGRKWFMDDGDLTKPSCLGNLPAGEVFIAPVENTINGTIVFDYFPLAKTKLKIQVENGRIAKMSKQIKKIREILEKHRANHHIGEFGIGTNPKAKIIKNVLEFEKALGTAHFAIGNNLSFGGKISIPFHMDGIIKKPLVKVDNQIILKDGKLKV